MASFHILTFGCKVNQCDSQILREALTSWGLAEANPQEAGGSGTDIFIINTCTVTSAADAKFRKALRRIKRENPDALVLVTGCYANKICASGDHVEGADMVFSHRDFSKLADFLDTSLIRGHDADALTGGHLAAMLTAHPQSCFAEHTRAFLKIQDGCDCYCAYCIVPTVRNKLWSEKPDNVIASINSLASKGYKEVVLTGIHLGFFGRDADTGKLLHLLRRIETECEIDRVRLSSIEINEVTDEILDLIAGSRRICRHLHLPLQSGDDTVLLKMGRKYLYSFFAKRIEDIRGRIPDIGITTDVIVGFPGETQEQFENTCNAIDTLEPAKIHVFRFSSRPGTRAADMDSRIPEKTISLRARRLMKVGDCAARKLKERFIGETVSVLAESLVPNENACTGLTSNYIRVKISNATTDHVNRLIPVRLASIEETSGLMVGAYKVK